MFVAVSIEDVAKGAIAAVPIGLLLVAIASAYISAANERKRSQPIVIAHEEQARSFRRLVAESGWVVLASLTNEGGGAAFNVVLGVEFRGVRHAYRMRPEDPDTGNRQRVVRQGERLPPSGAFPILVTSSEIWSGEGDPDPGRVYWCRYQNAQGKTWETLNPGDRSADLDIRRVRFVRWHEHREQRKRNKARRKGADWEAKLLAEVREAAEEALSTRFGDSTEGNDGGDSSD